MPTFDEIANEINGRTGGEGGSTETDDPMPDANGSGAGGTQSSTEKKEPWPDKLNDTELPNPKDGFPTVYDPEWTRDMWETKELVLDLPKKPEPLPTSDGQTDNRDPCMANCIQQQQRAQENCNILRRRVEMALESQGCPSYVTPKPKEDMMNSSGGGCRSCGCGATTASQPRPSSSNTYATNNNTSSACNSGTCSLNR